MKTNNIASLETVFLAAQARRLGRAIVRGVIAQRQREFLLGTIEAELSRRARLAEWSVGGSPRCAAGEQPEG